MTFVLAITFFVFLLGNVPIVFTLGAAAVFALLWEGHIPLLVVPQRVFTGVDSFPLLAIPLFILAGELMEHSGISARLVRLAQVLVGWLRGGIGMSVVVAEIFFSGISGSTVADTSALGTTMIPAMRRAGYSAPQATAIVAAASGMGILIPPCINMVVYGIMAHVSIAALFAAGFLPAFAMAALLMAQLYVQARRDPKLVVSARPSAREAVSAVGQAVVPLLMPVIIFGGILGGIFTATEAGAVAVVYGLFVGTVLYRAINLQRLYAILLETARISGQIMLLVGVAALFAWLLSSQQVPQALSEGIQGIASGPILFLLLSIVVMLLLGAVLDGLPAMIMLVPVLLPMATQFNVDPLHFGIIIIAVIGVGLFLPPIGLGLIVAAAIGRVKISEVVRPLMPYLATMMATVLLITFWPRLTLLVPMMLGLR
ncbi:MAG TPA: TRAP transporter large permease [Burkholderiales bacterium]|jgi:C4-dicarboxylate transporter DctM subunit|nr:TRAP transporter large permease [Burkholderiales bacterium]